LREDYGRRWIGVTARFFQIVGRSRSIAANRGQVYSFRSGRQQLTNGLPVFVAQYAEHQGRASIWKIIVQRLLERFGSRNIVSPIQQNPFATRTFHNLKASRPSD